MFLTFAATAPPTCFVPFFATKSPEQGRGLGLASTYATVVRAGGDVWCDSSPEGGAAFHRVLPADDPMRRDTPTTGRLATR
jgi:C4-dicarboxylate-specific signal transduction histidine kinase